MKRIAIIAEYDPDYEPHVATERAIRHSAESLELQIEYQWVSTQDISKSLFTEYDALWVGPGSPYKNMDNTLGAIKNAREHDIPLLGTCGGCQHVIIEMARNVLGFKDAQHAEYDPYSSKLFISELSCSLAGREMVIDIVPGSKVAQYYGATKAREKYYCNFGVNPEYIEELRKAPMDIVGSDSEGEIRIIEIAIHRFFVATLFVPQASSTQDNPHPLVTGFLKKVVCP